MVNKLGFEISIEQQVPIFSGCGLKFFNQAKFHPFKYLSSLLEAIGEKGGQVFEETKVERIDSDSGTVHTAHGRIRCERIILATNSIGHAERLFDSPIIESRLERITSYVVGATAPPGKIPEAFFWDASRPYFYLRVDHLRHRDRLVFGGLDNRGDVSEGIEAKYRVLANLLRELIPEASIERSWSG